MTNRAALLHYLAVTERRPVRMITAYMQRWYGATPHATRTQLWRLTNEGVIWRVGYGRYASAPPAELETKPAALNRTIGASDL